MKRELLNRSRKVRKNVVRKTKAWMASALLLVLLLAPAKAWPQVLLDEENYGSPRDGESGYPITFQFDLVPYQGGDIDQTPLGDGWLLLGGLGLAYFWVKRKKASRSV